MCTLRCVAFTVKITAAFFGVATVFKRKQILKKKERNKERKRERENKRERREDDVIE
jgi:heme exporter protein D